MDIITFKKVQGIKSVKNEFRGINVLVSGDSITDSIGTASIKWHDYLSSWFSFNVKNDGKSATGLIRSSGSADGLYDRINTWDSTYGHFDIVLIMGNMNDGGLGPDTFPLGDFSDGVATESQYGALHATIQKLITKYPNTPIGWIISTPRLASTTYPEPHNEKAWGIDSWFEPYCQAIIEVCNHYSIPYLDLYHDSGLRPWDTNNNAFYFFNSDGVHPNNLGHEVMAHKIYEFARKFLRGTWATPKKSYGFELGTSNGAILIEATNRIRTSNFVLLDSGKLSVLNNAKHEIAVWFYSSPDLGSYLSNVPSWNLSHTIDNSATTHVLIALRKKDESDFIQQEIDEANNYFIHLN